MNTCHPQHQKGAALLVSLVLLLILTVLALASANRSTLQERMAANSQDSNRAFQSAEAGRVEAFTRMDTSFRTAAPGTSATWNAAVGSQARYCAQMTLAKNDSTLTRYSQTQGNTTGVGKPTTKYYAAEVTVQGALAGDTNCTNPLAVHVSGYIIPRL